MKEYKDIKDNYSWNDENKGEAVYSEPAKSKHSPKIYDLQTPLKKSRKDDMESNMVSDMFSDMVPIIDNVKDGVHKRGKKATTSSKLASKNV